MNIRAITPTGETIVRVLRVLRGERKALIETRNAFGVVRQMIVRTDLLVRKGGPT